MVPSPEEDAPVQRFVADRMLGRLARWLRILGHDVAYGRHLGRDALVACARRQGRLLLTRDTRLVRRHGLPPHLFLSSDRFREQLQQVAAWVPLARGRVLGCCLGCNHPLEDVRSREQARERVPAYVFATAPYFMRCSRCGRLYWPATHHAHMRRELATLGLLDPVTTGGERT